MGTAKSGCGLTGERFRNGESTHRCWVQTISHLSLINRLSQPFSTSHILHRELANAKIKADEKAINAVKNYFYELQPFDSDPCFFFYWIFQSEQ